MPSAVQSPASSAHRNVTAVIGIVEALAMDVTVSGDRCALYLQTLTGQVKVLMPAARFLASARAERDSNGKPFPKLASGSRSAMEQQLEADAARSRPKDLRARPVAIESAYTDGTTAPLPPVPAAAYVGPTLPLKVERVPPPLTDYDRLAALPRLPDAIQRADRYAALRKAWEFFIASPAINYVELGHQLGCYPSLLRRSFDGFAAEPGAPVLKPNGKL